MNIIPLSIPTPFYIGDVNVYLVKDDPLTLIDVGPKTAEAKHALETKLRENGVKISDIRRIVLTHAHEDHCGLAVQLRDEAKTAEIFVHEWETGHLFGRLSGEERQNLLFRAGIPETVVEQIRETYEKISLLTDVLTGGEFSALRDESELEFATGALKVLHTPGHTPGSCSFLREANRTIIAGDTILKRVTPNPIIASDPFDKQKRFQSLAEYLVSLAKIKSCAPTLVCGGHGEPVDDYDELFNRYVREIDARQRNVAALVSAHGITAFDAAQKLFPAAMTSEIHRFLAISETVAHLDYAEQTGKIAVELRGETEFYRKSH